MVGWGLTDEGIKKLYQSGLKGRVDAKWPEIMIEVMRHTPYADDEDIREAMKGAPADRKKAIKDWKRDNPLYDTDSNGLFMVSGVVTDFLLSGDERSNPESVGFESISQVDGVLAAYCLSKYSAEPLGPAGMYSKYTWRSMGRTTSIYGNHSTGDLQMSQETAIPKDLKSLVGPLKERHIGAHYVFWPILVATALKYYDTIGEDVRNVREWRSYFSSLGWDGKIRSPSMSDAAYPDFLYRFPSEVIARLPDQVDVTKVRKTFFGRMKPDSDQTTEFLPVIDENNGLMFCANYGEGNPIKISTYRDFIVDYFPKIMIPKEDSHHVFEGSVYAILNGQSRTFPEHLAHMMWEYDLLKSGAGLDEIMRRRHEFDRS